MSEQPKDPAASLPRPSTTPSPVAFPAPPARQPQLARPAPGASIARPRRHRHADFLRDEKVDDNTLKPVLRRLRAWVICHVLVRDIAVWPTSPKSPRR